MDMVSTPGMGRFLINFDIPQTNATALNANLYLYATPSSNHNMSSFGHSSNRTNRHQFNRVTSAWDESTVTWNNQPAVDESTNLLTEHIPGAIGNPSFDDYVFNMNHILLDNGQIFSDFNGIMCRAYQDVLLDYYRGMQFANTRGADFENWPTLNIDYQVPEPTITFNKAQTKFSLEDVDDLEDIFYGSVTYIWNINGRQYYGNSARPTKSSTYNVSLTIIAYDDMGEEQEFGMTAVFDGNSGLQIAEMESEELTEVATPEISYDGLNKFSITNADKESTGYIWTVNGNQYYGNSIRVKNADSYAVSVKATVTNYLGENLEAEAKANFTNNHVKAFQTTGMDGMDIPQDSKINIYPNPADNMITVYKQGENEISAYRIYSVTGTLMNEGIYVDSTINVSGLQTGMYIIEFTDNEGKKETASFIKL